ncbi:MAG: hypothetical protein J0I99_00850 [Devosia sp.]|uniref:hypothetical protein n=1 Tax=Devosia sp. TaxID=1871048 RepID=UPI001AC56E55|nr:hypothetical protein [Devosia sp.]MBN9314266.1 hypothetical protein [Devosia sp.]
MKFDFTWLPDGAGQLLIAGVAGGIVRWATLREKWPDGLISILVGALCAVFVGPAAFPLMGPMIDFSGIDPNSAKSLAGFMIGAGGILMAGFLIDLWRERRRQLKAAPPENFVVITQAKEGDADASGNAG